MTNLLLKLFVKNHKNTESAKVRTSIGTLAGAVGIFCNILLFAVKLVTGILSASVSITADAMNNLSDATSSIVTLIGFRLAKRPADEDHPYGHARYEYLAGLAVSALILIIGFELAKTSVQKIISPVPVLFSLPVCAVLLISVIIKLWMAIFNHSLGKRINSKTLFAASADSRNDIIATSAVLIAGIVEHFTSWQIDGYIGFAVAVFIFYSGITLAKTTISPLLGENASAELQAEIISIIKNCPEVLGYHDLMVHDYGPSNRFASIHVEMDHKADPLFCHELIDSLEKKSLEKLNVNLVIHYDPIITGDKELESARESVALILSEIDNRISVHDFRMTKEKNESKLIFDVVLPAELMQKQNEIKKQLDFKLSEIKDKNYCTYVTFDINTLKE